MVASIEQIEEAAGDIKNAHLALDNIEIGRGDHILLWLFGYLY